MSSNTAWARSLATTIVKHLPEIEQAVLRNRPVGAMLDQRGKLSYGQGGNGFDWRVKYRLHDTRGNTGMTPRTFDPVNRFQVAELQYRGYMVSDAVFKKEQLENRGEQAIVKLGETMEADLRESLDEAFATEYYVDGEATGNETKMHGIESMMGTNGTVNITTGAQRSATAADLYGYPNDTYAGLTTGLGDYGGSQRSGIWPNGQADAQYDYFSPIIVNYTSSALPGATDTWAAQGIEAMREGIIQCHRNGGMDNQLDLIALDRSLYTQALNALDDKERALVTNQNGIRAFGFKNVFELDGVEVTWDYGIPSAVGYGFNFDAMELLSMQDQLFAMETEYDIDSQSTKWVVDFLGNLKFKSPRNFLKLMTLA